MLRLYDTPVGVATRGRSATRRCPRLRPWGAHDPPAVHDHRGHAAGRHRASGQRSGTARIATQDAYSRLTPITTLNSVIASPWPIRQRADAVHGSGVRCRDCRYDLTAGPIKLAVRSARPTLGVVLTRNEVAYYAINDRSAGRKVIELDLMTEAQHADLPEDEDVTAADRLIIESPTATGLIVLKALAPEPGLMPQAQGSLAASSCKVADRTSRRIRRTAAKR